jgi:hypothetical protein
LKIYGSITNSSVHTRKNYKPPTLQKIAKKNLAAITKTIESENLAAAAEQTKQDSLNEEQKAPFKKTERAEPITGSTVKSKGLTNSKGGALFSSFAKAKAKPPAPAPALKPKIVVEEDSMCFYLEAIHNHH